MKIIVIISCIALLFWGIDAVLALVQREPNDNLIGPCDGPRPQYDNATEGGC